MSFNELNIEGNILRALTEMGYEQPTPIQQNAIPPVLEGLDLLGCAQTGTGKTCAFSVPMIQRLMKNGRPQGRPVRGLVLTPTRELALQIFENVRQYARYTPVRGVVIFGGVSQGPQVEALKRGADILIATPGRLLDLMQQGLISLSKVECFVLDEADRMLDMGFFPDVKRVLQKLPEKRQTLLFSATMPKEIAALADRMLHNPARISVAPSAKPVDIIEQKVYFVEKADKRQLVPQLIREYNVHQTLVFTRTKHGADRVARDLNRAGITARSIHGDKSQNQRQTALRDFKAMKVAVLVATDIAARGIDISELPLVINFELPNVPETYVHRIGRTGRAGQEGTAVSFCDSSERPYLKDIERTIGKSLPVEGEVVAAERPPEAARGAKNHRQRRPLHSERAPAAEVAAEVQRQSEQKRARRTKAAPQKPQKRSGVEKNQRIEQAARAAAPRPQKRSRPQGMAGRGGRRTPERDDRLSVDAHTPSRAHAMSEEAANRIRKKVAAALAGRRAK